MDDDLAAPALLPMLPQKDPLPGAEGEPPAEDRDAEGGGGEGRLDVRGHVVGSFDGVGEERVVRRHQPLEPGVEVAARGRVGVLLDGEAGRRVPDEERAQPLVGAALPDHRGDPVGDLVEPRAGDVDGEGADHGVGRIIALDGATARVANKT